ncbi:hypothetical protein DFJ58DRAFT_861777 [Suillus subalutaceus]|uniref:uncharacterized protein n=2 Tax=Suillus subalutaceus TaxID=48586 RepID=UPI001B8782E7|nr:uncharacterized protein DFJ58DRAFT_861777 [Suillus subalutaceus]KAG1838200.1 hypothetical protein DFJ58DRAFT_861777 [Suillus subalutaceus]
MQHLKDQLAELRLCLAALPTDIPIPKESKYKFSNFTLDAEWTADIGEAAAVNRELEVRLGSRVNGLKLVERGPEMEAIVHVFETWTKKFPGDVILEKWVNDTLEAARGLILAAGKASLSRTRVLRKKKPVKVNHTQIPEKRKPKVQKLDTHILSTFDDDRYISAGEDEDSRKGGAKMHPLLRKALAIKLYSVVPVSMADERTVSTITWLNSPTRSRQDISTSKEHIQIRQWHRWKADHRRSLLLSNGEICMQPSMVNLRQPPVVPPPARPPTMTTDIISSLTDEHQGRCSDSDDEDGDWLDNGDIADHVGLAGVKSTEFDVGKDINISSTYLLDILSDHALQPTAACGGLSTPKVMAATTSSSTPMDDDEWEEW